MATATVTQTATAIEPPSNATTISVDWAKRDVQTKLVYWKSSESKYVPVDFTKPDGESVFSELTKLDEEHAVRIHDIRGEESNYTLDKNGFQYVHHEIPDFDEWSNEERVKEVLIPQTEELVRKITGATRTVVFTTRIRSLATDEAKRADNRAPAHSVHSDCTVVGAVQNLKMLVTTDPAEAERLLQNRVMVINVWRPLKTVTKDPLAMCDWTSVKSADEWIANRFIFPHGWNELGKVAYSEQHRWCYLSRQTPAEPVLFKQFDSLATETGGFTLAHSAFVDPEFVDAAPRESIEIKMYCFFDS